MGNLSFIEWNCIRNHKRKGKVMWENTWLFLGLLFPLINDLLTKAFQKGKVLFLSPLTCLALVYNVRPVAGKSDALTIELSGREASTQCVLLQVRKQNMISTGLVCFLFSIELTLPFERPNGRQWYEYSDKHRTVGLCVCVCFRKPLLYSRWGQHTLKLKLKRTERRPPN